MTYLAAAIQMNAGPDKPANLERAERLIRVGAARGANLIALPEVFNWRGKRNEQAAAAETLDGQTLTLMSRLARELQIHIVAGSITEQTSPANRDATTRRCCSAPTASKSRCIARFTCSTSISPAA